MQWQKSLIFFPFFIFVMRDFRSANTMFAVEWLGHKVALKANNGKYICTKKNGQLLAVSDSTGTTLLGVLPPLLLNVSLFAVAMCQVRTNSSL